MNSVIKTTDAVYLTKISNNTNFKLDSITNQYQYTDEEVLNGITELKSDILTTNTNSYEIKYFLNIQSKTNINNTENNLIFTDEIKMFKQVENNYYMYEMITEIMDTLCFPNLKEYDTRIMYEETIINLKSLPNIEIIIKKYGKNNNSITIKLAESNETIIKNILDKLKYLI